MCFGKAYHWANNERAALVDSRELRSCTQGLDVIGSHQDYPALPLALQRRAEETPNVWQP